MTQLPKHVVHFYRNIEYALQCIAFKQITVVHREKLNDPFDLYYQFETGCENYQSLINYVQQYHRYDLQKFIKIMPRQTWESELSQIEQNLNKFRNNIFVFSATGISEGDHPKDNLYMWSHYGDGHRGLAIEFDTFLLANAVMKQQEQSDKAKLNINDLWSKVNYQQELPEILCEHIFHYIMNKDNVQLEEILALRFSSKSIGWKIENEWRLMWQKDDTKLKILRLDLLDDTISAIYLGCSYKLNSDYLNDDIIFETRRHFPKAKIFKMKKRKGKFALDCEPINNS